MFFFLPLKTAAWTTITSELLASLMTAAIADEQDLKRGELVIECLTFLIQRLYVMDEGHVSCFYMLYIVYMVLV